MAAAQSWGQRTEQCPLSWRRTVHTGTSNEIRVPPVLFPQSLTTPPPLPLLSFLHLLSWYYNSFCCNSSKEFIDFWKHNMQSCSLGASLSRRNKPNTFFEILEVVMNELSSSCLQVTESKTLNNRSAWSGFKSPGLLDLSGMRFVSQKAEKERVREAEIQRDKQGGEGRKAETAGTRKRWPPFCVRWSEEWKVVGS